VDDESQRLSRQIEDLRTTLASARIEAERLYEEASRTDSALVQKYASQPTVTGADLALLLEKMHLIYEHIHKIDLRIQAIENWQIDTMLGS
jgi:hypothetical protein